MYLIIDTETTGLPISNRIPITDTQNWPRLVQCSWHIYDILGNVIEYKNVIIRPENYDIPFNSFKIHGITNEIALKYGIELKLFFNIFQKSISNCKYIIGHNVEFDINVISSEFIRKNTNISLKNLKIIDTKIISTNFCKIPGLKKKFKWPTLSELYYKLFGEKIVQQLHSSHIDVKFTARCFFELLRIGIISNKHIKEKENIISFTNMHTNTIPFSLVCCKEENNYEFYKEIFKTKIKKKEKIIIPLYEDIKIKFFNKKYFHLHNHTHFSVLHSTISIKSLIKQVISYNMTAVGITDYGNLMGAYYFLHAINTANKKLKNKIKGIVGCELFISDNYLKKKFTKEFPDKIYNQVLIAKNKEGYKNLTKICSIGFKKGMYSGKPRIGKEIVKKYKKNIIALTGDINSEIPYYIINYGVKKAEKVFLWWKTLFGNDFYIELFRHGLEEENYINKILINFSKKYKVKYIIQNNIFYIDKKEHDIQDILLCIKQGEKKNTPIGTGKGFRFGFYTQEYYFKKSEQMMQIFNDFPEAFDYLNDLEKSIDFYDISRKINLPNFYKKKTSEENNIQQDENIILKKIAYKGAKKRYGNIELNIKNRINFELNTIKKIGYPGYFLIIYNLIQQAKKMNITVGPGRGSVAGSLVAYCIEITNIDPIKYNLLFERFLNIDRISLPDIDIDFDDKGRERIIEWVVNKYGWNQVSQIITYSTMGAKSSIRDVGRVLGLSLKETDKLAKMIPNDLSLNQIFSDNIYTEKMNKKYLNNIKNIHERYRNFNCLSGKVIRTAKKLEGTIRSTGIHACGIIISSDDITNYVPVSISKYSNLLVTQFDNNVIEHMGLLKIDFLGLKTLTIIKNAIKLVSQTKKKSVVFSLIDQKTYDIFKNGETIAIFQYESIGMQKYLKQLTPDKFEDLIAMNALYRPGPMQYIPNFIKRKHGKEKIKYDVPELKKILHDTYGITLYQEQVMLIAKKIASFNNIEADLLRKSIGKKEKNILFKMKNKFFYRSKRNGYKEKIINKIWKDLESFACYAFNKSHATCYAYIAFQTAYLKSHFPCEYMCSVLSNNVKNTKQFSILIKECRRMNLYIIGPDINKSSNNFTVFNKNTILFGLSGIKGLGQNAVQVIIKERTLHGKFTSIFDFVKRVDLRIINKKTLEHLIISGSLDIFSIRRDIFFIKKENNISILERIMQHAIQKKNIDKNQIISDMFSLKNLSSDKDRLNILYKEKEVLGVYITSHPLKKYIYEIKYLTNISILDINNKKYKKNNIYALAGIVIEVEEKTSFYNQKKYCRFIIEDYTSYKEFMIYGDQYFKYINILKQNNLLYIILGYNKNNKLRILYIENLVKILDKFINTLIIKIDYNILSNNLINNIESIIKNQCTGNKKICIIIYKNNQKLNFLCDKYRININHAFLKKLENINGLKFCFS